ncbi:MAG: YraN family protein [Candidatus Cloacimonetes bacterium]|nr:YraN family protein [Candidatus Cloacimonadota bacterium]MBS3767166.1 YraN family protein [Candidatus Cloacimonadota bacterium]
MVNRYKLAKFGEDIAAKYLKHNGYKILERNYHSVYGEIDIICQKDAQLIFVEVKTRRSNKYGSPLEAITESKKQKIIKASYEYIADRDLELPMRYDVITIKYIPSDDNYAFKHMKNVFFAESYSNNWSSK